MYGLLLKFLILILISVIRIGAASISDVAPCTFSQIDKCILKQAPLIIHALENGIPSLEIPKFNPYHMDTLLLKSEENMEVELFDISIYGVPDGEVQDLRVKFRKRRGYFKVYFRKLTIEAKYRINGLYITDFDNVTGNSVTTLEDVVVELNAKFNVNSEKLELSDADIDVQLDGFDIRSTADSLSDEIKVGLLRDYINQNWKMLHQQYNHAIIKLMKDIILPILTKIGNVLLAKLLMTTRRKSRDF